MSHTKEPLQLAGGGLIYRLSAPENEGGHNVDEINVTMWGESRMPDDRAEGAQRVMACMDACAGISNDDLKMFAELGATQMQSYDEVKTQRDELLAALKTIIKDDSHNPSLMVMIAKEAIASVEGERKLTIDNAPVGTQAPAINGGRWYRTERGWKWNGPDGAGSTFPGPGADWNGQLIAPDSVKGGA